MYKQVLLFSNNTVGLLDHHNKITVVKNLHEKEITQALVSDQHLVTGSYDKLVKVWKLTKTGVEQNPFYQMQLPKKIKRIVYVNGEYLVSDKHGDIYEINKEELSIGSNDEIIKKTDPKSSNLAIPKYFDCFTIAGKKILILGDDYCKIKLINAINTDEILNILIPLEGFLKQVIPLNHDFIMLFKIVDENNSTTCFKAFKIAQQDILNDNAQFDQIFPVSPQEEVISNADNVKIFISGGKIKYIYEKEGSTFILDRVIIKKLENTTILSLNNHEDQWIFLGKQKEQQVQENLQLAQNVSIVVEDTLIQWVV